MISKGAYSELSIAKLILSIKYGPYLKSVDKGSVKYLKGIHFDEDFLFTRFEDSYVAESEDSNKYVLNEGQVLLASKGYRYYAFMVDESLGRCVASSQFYVINVNEEVVTPAYFTLLLNSKRMQGRLAKLKKGATIPILPRKELLAIKVKIPSIKYQIQVSKIYELLKEQIRIQRTILEKKLIIKENLINKLTK